MPHLREVLPGVREYFKITAKNFEEDIKSDKVVGTVNIRLISPGEEWNLRRSS